MKKFMVIFLALALAMAFTACNKDGGAEAASVNGKKITVTDLEDEIESLPAQYKMFGQSPEMKRKILDNLVITEVLLQQAEKEGVLAKPDVQAKIKEYEASIKADIETQIFNLKKQKEKASGIAKRETVIKAMLEGRDFKEVAVSEAELKDAYSKYVASMKKQDPNAKVEPLEKLKEDIRLSLARQKWLDEIKTKADIKVNESALGAQAPAMPGTNPVKIVEQGK